MAPQAEADLKLELFAAKPSLSKEEWLHFAAQCSECASAEDLPTEMLDFAKVDLDKSGTIEENEVDRFLQGVMEQVGASKYEALITKLERKLSIFSDPEFESWKTRPEAQAAFFDSLDGGKKICGPDKHAMQRGWNSW